jgi:succinate dehydrogenase/fumarate reductase-like Fe-S protein
MRKNVITAKIQRFDPEIDKSPRYQEYQVETVENMSVLGLVKYIHDNMDRTLAYRNVGCYLGVCIGCLMNINGKNLRACSTTVRPGDEVSIEPAKKGYTVVRDLVVGFGMKEQLGSKTIDESTET